VTPIRYYIVCRERFSLYASTGNGDQVIHTAELCGANSLDYLTELRQHAAELAKRPAEWMPWNYRESMVRTAG
jgi:hypothetical protein